MAHLENGVLDRQTFVTQALMDDHPPKLNNGNKQVVYNIACPVGTSYRDELEFSRWAAMKLPQTFLPATHQTNLMVRSDYFDYEPGQDPQQMEWYLNFAHSDLFCAYGGSLFAQDEMQVAEHPALAALREALLAQNITPFTVESGNPTPILISGVERRCTIEIDPNPSLGRPNGLYGNNFARAKSEAIQQATQPLNPPTITNIIAIEAPIGGYGTYTIAEIKFILTTALTGFTAACIESQRSKSSDTTAIKTTIHTGFWGCGAYGGNRVLMALLQLLAAQLAQVDCLVFHTGAAEGHQPLMEAQAILDTYLKTANPSIKVADLLKAIVAMRFQWGSSDGN